ncbi:PREDICTED: uncharacterized protein LOC108764496 [Trachymyrmex cornetzi]|uniref:uncharacterized protein LOC108764496 n=1 Tax=Trachymyrmex cornetzi TaxID=471704 RepID=UPI00084F0007|nr:PREDICTED: uncharacterized protein LOC108764496 [Trachymyrmex cornetzi]
MKEVYLLLLTICTYVLAINIEGPHCFHFTWPGPSHAEVNKLDCEEHENNQFTPCIEPLFFYDKKPNVTKLWEDINKNNNTKYIQRMQPGYVCVSYTFMYNGAVMNISYFHGKVTEDQVTPIISGCYLKYTEGYTIEVCACKSKNGNVMPCNSTIRNRYSTLIIFAVVAVSLFMYKIFDIP